MVARVAALVAQGLFVLVEEPAVPGVEAAGEVDDLRLVDVDGDKVVVLERGQRVVLMRMHTCVCIGTYPRLGPGGELGGCAGRKLLQTQDGVCVVEAFFLG